MKTNVSMIRKMGNFDIIQRTSDGYFDGNALMSQWKKENRNNRDSVSDFLQQKKVQEFMDCLEKDLGNEAQSQKWDMGNCKSIRRIKGKNTDKGRTMDKIFMHPYLFVKFAMWINSSFELQVVKFVFDQLIEFRHEAGDNYNVLTESIARLPDVDYRYVAIAIQWIVFNRTGKNLRQNASQKELKEIAELEKKIAFMIDMNFVRNNAELINALRKIYNDKYSKF